MEDLRIYIELVAKMIESLGVIIIASGCFFFIFRHLWLYLIMNNLKPFVDLRRKLGKSILIGLEVLIAADIIATVSTEPTMERVLVLAIVVGIRTFLSFALEIEVDGRFPWQAKKHQENSLKN